MRIEGGAGRGLHISLEEGEAQLLRGLFDEMAMLLAADLPGDAVKERLFPRAFEDDEDETSFRSLVSDDLQAVKREALAAARETLGMAGAVEANLEPDTVEAWLRLLTDLRLSIGTRLDVTEATMSTEPDPQDPDGAAYSVLHWLGWIQESMLERLTA